MTPDSIDGAALMARLDRMAEISEDPGHLARRSFTPQHRQVNDLVAGWMIEAGMSVREDPLGNVIGRYEGHSPGAPAILLGSHVDTVIMAGRYDGALGVVSAIAVVAALNARGIRYDNAIEVAAFGDEEGVRFHTTYLSSAPLAGRFDPGLLDRADAEGIPLSQAMREFGLDPLTVGQAARAPGDLRCYLEVHIEQGPVLEAQDLAVGAVTAISGATRMLVTVTGMAGHAGTVPMTARRDALTAACHAVLLVDQTARAHDQAVGTVGRVDVAPGAPNVIPSQVTFTVDLRAPDDDVRRAAAADLIAGFAALADRMSVEIDAETKHDGDGAACAPWVRDRIQTAMADLGHPACHLPSGAGHDAAALSHITDIGMIFVRCKGGISHNPAESITPEDAAAGAAVLLKTVELIGGAVN